MISTGFFCRWKLRLEIISLRPHSTIIVDTHIFHVFLWDPLIMCFVFGKDLYFWKKKNAPKIINHIQTVSKHMILILYMYTYDSYDHYIVITRNFKTLKNKSKYSLKVLLPTISPWKKKQVAAAAPKTARLSKGIKGLQKNKVSK